MSAPRSETGQVVSPTTIGNSVALFVKAMQANNVDPVHITPIAIRLLEDYLASVYPDLVQTQPAPAVQ